MKILSLSPYPVYPASFGGQVRIYELLRHLAILGNEVTIAYNHSFGDRTEGSVDSVNFVPFKTYVQDFAIRLHELGLMPLIATSPVHALMGPAYKDLFKGYDVVMFEQPFLSSWMKWIPQDSLRVYSAQNVEIDYENLCLEDHLTSRFGPIKALYKHLLRKCEERAIELSELVVCVSEEDKRRLTRLYNTGQRGISVVENGYDPRTKEYEKGEVLKELELEEGLPVAVFIGSGTPPNFAAVRRICDVIAPHADEITFLLIGESSLGHDSPPKNVKVLGPVEDPDKYLQIAHVGLLPIEEGSGSNLKLLHYMKNGLEVVTTEFGMRGFGRLRPYVNIGDIRDFPGLIRSASCSKKLRPKVIEEYSWPNLATRLERCLNESRR